MPLVYAEMRRIADRRLRTERAGHTLQPTALVHEACLKLVDQQQAPWQNRAHFLACAAHAMRQILVDYARARRTGKRGGGAERVGLSQVQIAAGAREVDVLALEQALERLGAMDARQARVVELRYFGGLSVEETAEVLGVSAATVKNEWAVAKAWLHQQLAGDGEQ
jgi:RNA polymerase sigma-70 factor (ECF subfamily)